MILKQISDWLVLAVVISYHAAVSLGDLDTVNATIGEPFVLRFGYKGHRLGVRYHFSKDGKTFVPEKLRVLQIHGRLSFVEITDSDAGLYKLEMEGRRICYTKSINLFGTYLCTHTKSVNCLQVATYI